MRTGCGKAQWGTVLVVLVAATLLARLGSAGRANPAAPARVPSVEHPQVPGKSPREATPAPSVEPTETQLPPVDPTWRQNGWRAVVPHAHVLRRLVPVRVRPEPTASAAFWLAGGTRVPILEQDRQWWRVGWTRGRTGWVRAIDLEPRASLVLIDAASGRVIRRMAVKGQRGPLPQGQFLWTLANTGLTRILPGERPVFWSNAKVVGTDRFPSEGQWTQDRTRFFIRREEVNGGLLEIDARTGAIRPAGDPGFRFYLEHADREGRVLFSEWTDDGERRNPRLYDTRHQREIRRVPGELKVVAKTGVAYVYADAASSGSGAPAVRIRERENGEAVRSAGAGREIIRYDADLKPGARRRLAGELLDVCLSADERTLSVSYKPKSGGLVIQLLHADTLAPLVTLQPPRVAAPYSVVFGLTGGPRGWLALQASQEEGSEGYDEVRLVRYDGRGRVIRSWRGAPPEWTAWAMSDDGGAIYVARESDILVVNSADGSTRTIPLTWRRPLPQRYLAESDDPDTPTHLEISDLTLTHDGRTLILTEWLNGDPDG